jgi:hypothetical protein
MKSFAIGLLAMFALSCSDPATFRPAKGLKDYPSTKSAYRVQEPQDGCTELGFVIKASSISDIAETAASHGGTHYQVLDDASSSSTETDAVATQSFGIIHARSSSYEVKHHGYIARVYRC